MMRFIMVVCMALVLAGCAPTARGPVYEGDYLDGKPHGQGVMVNPDGTRIEGEWIKGVIQG